MEDLIMFQVMMHLKYDEYFCERYKIHFEDSKMVFTSEGCSLRDSEGEAHKIAIEEASHEWHRRRVSENILGKLMCDPKKANYAGKIDL